MNYRTRQLLFFLVLVVPFSIMATKIQNLDPIANAIQNGNAKALSQYFDATVELKVLTTEGAYSKAQAEQVMKDFFANNAPKIFSFNKSGSSGGANGKYGIGSLTTANGKFRAYVYLKKKGDTFLIQELKIENE